VPERQIAHSLPSSKLWSYGGVQWGRYIRQYLERISVAGGAFYKQKSTRIRQSRI
jgi:hypothetical protein